MIAIGLLLIATSSQAATVQLGLGFDRAHNGHGFDLHKVGNTYVLYFYTYDAMGDPEWLLGIADMKGGVISGQLLRFTYDFQNQGPESQDMGFSGSFSLDFNNAASSAACQDGTDRAGAQQLSRFSWQTGADSGEWCTEFLAIGNSYPGGDYYGGVWFAGNSDSGYGFTMSHMDNTVAAIIYYYDASGQPRWVLGFGGDQDASLDMLHFDGYCRSCAVPVGNLPTTSAGSLSISWDGATPPGSGNDTADINISYPKAPFGDFPRQFTMVRLSDGQPTGTYTASGGSSATQDFYNANISAQVIQTKCIICHVAGGVAGATRLLYQKSDIADYQTLNLQTIRDFINTVSDGASLVLSKPLGENQTGGQTHGGGEQLQVDSQEYADLKTLVQMIQNEGGSGGTGGNGTDFFEGVGMMDAQATLRKAAILLAGRLPTAEEMDAVASGDDAALRATLKGLMTGPAFHQFLIEGANDRLLTDKFLNDSVIDAFDPYYPAFSNAVYDIGLGIQNRTRTEDELYQFIAPFNYGVARSPVELIAHVVEKDLPYSEVLTADYVMVNPALNDGFVAGASFSDPADQTKFEVGHTQGYMRIDENMDYTCLDMFGCTFSGGLPTTYPHAGVLNTPAFLDRYPSTATNRNRARARWTYYFFLNVDIEALASRPIDSDSLMDTNNPTLNNPNCAVCHQVHDPVAGTYQNYGDRGFFRDQPGGLDSLPESYKYPRDGDTTPYLPGDTWYADMRTPGFEGKTAPDPENSLQWLAQQIVADSRFPVGTVHFWWPAIFGAESLEAPEDDSDLTFPQQQAAFKAQSDFMNALAAKFSSGGMKLKDLIVDMIDSDWFRANSADNVSAERLQELSFAKAGVEQLLTPESLNRKLAATTGYAWGYQGDNPGEGVNFLTQTYRLFYGGIDSNGIIKRARDMTPMMTRVIATMAAESACPIVVTEFNEPDAQRLLFKGMSRSDTPVLEATQTDSVTAASAAETQTFSLNTPASAGAERIRVAFLNDFFDSSLGDRNLIVDKLAVKDGNGAVIAAFEAADVNTVPGATAGCGDVAFNETTQKNDDWNLYGNCALEFPVTLPADGSYSVTVDAWGQQAGPDTVQMSITLNGTDASAGTSVGAQRIKQALQGLHERLLGETVSLSDTELERSYQLFASVWSSRVAAEEPPYLNHPCSFQFDDWQTQAADPAQVMSSWIATMVYFLTDYKFLYQ